MIDCTALVVGARAAGQVQSVRDWGHVQHHVVPVLIATVNLRRHLHAQHNVEPHSLP